MIDSAQVLSLRMVDRYLAGQLSAEETAEFETYLLEHPEVLNEINVTRRLKLGLKSLRQRGELEGLVTGKTAMRNRQLAIAASVLVVLGLASWFFMLRGGYAPAVLAASTEPFGASLRSASPIDELLLVRTRSNDRITIQIPATPRLVLMRFVTSAELRDASFDVVLLPEAGGVTTVQRVENLRADADGTIAVYFDPHAAGAGHYVVRLLGRRADGVEAQIAEYAVELK